MNLRSKVELRLPLSQLHYDTYGFRFRWNEIWLAIPYEQQPLKFTVGHLLEEFKNNLKGKITIYLHWHRINPEIEKVEVLVDTSVSNEVADITSHIEQITSEIQSLVVKGALTLDEARIVLAESGFDYNDEKIHRILSEIVNNMPLQEIQQEVKVPLSSLQYDADGVRFSWGGVWFQVPGNKLTFEIGPILKDIKSSLTDTITFNIEKRCIVRWDSNASKLSVGQVTKDVSQADITPDTLEAFKELRGTMICDAINDIDRAILSLDGLDEVESILKEWGLDLSNQEIGNRIISSIPYWTQEWRLTQPAKDVQYSASGIVISSEGGTASIPREELPFETGDVLDGIKGILEGDIVAIIRQRVGFTWSETEQQLTIGRGIHVSYDVTVEDEFLRQLEYFDLEVEPAHWHEATRGRLKKPGKRPDARIEGVKYNPECVRFLYEKVKQKGGNIYMTTRDLWFEIGNVLVWERPEPCKSDVPICEGTQSSKTGATYVFEFPDKPVADFIQSIWSYELLEHIRDRTSGYIVRVIHDYKNGLRNWKANIESAIY